MTASRDRLSTLADELRAFGIQFEVEAVSRHHGRDRPLTPRQLELVQAAVERGYYDTPRDRSLTKLVSELNLSKSTVSETLHRAEGAIVKRFVDEFSSESFEDS